ncbi:MAG: HipA domain-containing protein [Emcibacter sp.]|nr:HipA domain-containing protein [Emcibacter sp.]
MADVIRQISSKPKEDLRELWSRIVFTILVSNKDDHLKNHGFIYAGRDRWRLSPAFDINPSPSRHRVLETGILAGETFNASLDLAIDASEFFDLSRDEAIEIAKGIAQVTSAHWREALRQEGASAADVKIYIDAFEHEEVEKALGLA